MININVLSVQHGLREGLQHLRHHGKPQDSRNGPVLVSPWPVCTTYQHPTNRVLFSPMRDANPWFHLMEALWMLAGRNDVAWVKLFNSRMGQYSDDGLTQHGAYGYRWRNWFDRDQLLLIIKELKADPLSRRCVLTMWDPNADLGRDGVDLPCNTHAYFDMRDGRLNMTVLCRSNDIWWGCYGANAVHFSFLLEYMAAMIGAPIGVYRQVSNNFHLYTDVVPLSDKRYYEHLLHDLNETDHFTAPLGNHQRQLSGENFKRVPLVDQPESFDADNEKFVGDPMAFSYHSNSFFAAVAQPMFQAWVSYKHAMYGEAEEHVANIKDGAWATACMDWLDRRKAKRLERQTHDD